MFHFITFHLRRMRESKTSSSGPGGAAAAKARKSQQEKAKARWVKNLILKAMIGVAIDRRPIISFWLIIKIIRNNQARISLIP